MTDTDLEQELLEKVKSVIQAVEAHDIEDQTNLYRHWVEERQEMLETQVNYFIAGHPLILLFLPLFTFLSLPTFLLLFCLKCFFPHFWLNRIPTRS